MKRNYKFESKVVCIKKYQQFHISFFPLQIYQAELETDAWLNRGSGYCIKDESNLVWFSPLWKTNADDNHPHFKEYFRIVYDARLAGEKPDCPDES
jgi:hypothetical protein